MSAKRSIKMSRFVPLIAVLSWSLPLLVAAEPAEVDFVRDVRPILQRHCVGCHGPKRQEARLRLDARVAIRRGGISGPLLDRDPDRSLLIGRLEGRNELIRMPFERPALSRREVALIRKWVVAGAPWPDGVGPREAPLSLHWAYHAPIRPPVPVERGEHRSVVDVFLNARIDEAGLVPAPLADRRTLVRRVWLDLLGVPPTPADVDSFLADQDPGAWERLIDRLLASPRYGERWASPWLDAARYADSNGYQRDGRREAWAWRDWVIEAINADLPFDRFTIEQLAGDLLTDATVGNRIATGFHRSTMANVEAGTDAEEERVLAVFDRVNTTGAVWLGSTLECAQCHHHKYDPFSQREYYRLFAFFNNTRPEIETTGSRRELTGPKVELPRPAKLIKRHRALVKQVKQLEKQQAALGKELKQQQPGWEREVREDPVAAGAPKWLGKLLKRPAGKRTAAEKKRVRKYHQGRSKDWTGLKASLTGARAERDRLAPRTTLVMSELKKPRVTRRLVRGDFLDPAEVLQAGTPAVLPPLAVTGVASRLDLARWLVDGRNPLVARVVVNRQWAFLFGRGLVESLEDFGTRGARPSHPLLLDWLATELVRLEWSRKRLHRLLVTSLAYRRRSVTSATDRRVDPGNRLYARASRRRLPAELVRDNSLAIAGLLSDKMGGPPVFPVQPPGVWNHIGVASNLWKTSRNEDLHRRGVYVYWRRTVPYPSFVNFDAPSREVCSVSRSQSNTPLQALTLLNDPVFFEAAGALAARGLDEVPVTAPPLTRLQFLFGLATSRRPTTSEATVLLDRYTHERTRLAGSPGQVRQLVERGHPRGRKRGEKQNVELAAWLHVANVILNLDEVITRE